MRTDCFEYTISKDGKFVFRTETEIYPECEGKTLYHLLVEKFPETEGYTVHVTQWECRGIIIE